MANIEKIKVGSTSYDVRDASAAHALSDIAIAGSGISFSGPEINYTVNGGLTISSDYVASGFSDSKYISVLNPLYAGGLSVTSYDLVVAIMLTSASPAAGVFDATNSSIRLTITGEDKIRLRISNAVDITTNSALNFNQKYWVKVSYSNSVGYKVYLSTNGTSWTEEASSSVLTSFGYGNYTTYIGRNNTAGYPFNGNIYLKDTYLSVNNGAYTWIAVDDRKKINTTTDVLKNTATGTDSLTILGTATSQSSSVNIGENSTASGPNAVAVGNTARANRNSSIAIGTGALSQGESSICIGGNASTGTNQTGNVVIGAVAKIISGNYNVAIGYYAEAGGGYAIQLGRGTNNTANTMNVGLSNNLNVQLLDSSGNVPAARLPIVTSVSNVSTDSQVPSAKLFYDTCGNITALINAL